MNLGNWIAVITVVFSGLGGMAALVQFLVKHYLEELKPNGGGSMRDELKQLSARVDEVYRILINKSLS